MARTDLPADVGQLRTEQDDVAASRQLRASVPRGRVRAELSGERWQSPRRGVLVLHNGPLTYEQRVWAALLASPSGTVLGGLTAARWDGLTGFERLGEQIHLVRPPSQRRVDLAGVALHWSRELGAQDVHPERKPARTRPARSLVDAASWSPGPRWARALVIAGVQQRLVRPADVSDALARRGRCRHRAVIAESVTDAAGGIASVPEHDFARLVARAGLPAPDRQRVVRGTSGRYYLDAAWEGRRLAAEVHGIHHREQWEDDLTRHNVITATGRRLLHFSSYAIRHESQDVVGLLAAAWGAA